MIRPLLIVALMLVASASAQDTRGQILGTVTDSGGAVVPGAVVRAINVNSGVESSAVTNSSGEYLIPFLIPGNYTVRAENPGFKRAERANVEVRISERIPVNIQLEVGAVSETVIVSANAVLLETGTASMGQV